MMVFWNAGFVLLTLAINAPMLPYVLRVTGLSKVRQADPAGTIILPVAANADFRSNVFEFLELATYCLVSGFRSA